ncbi:Rap1a/Tai family immunity protein [Xanthomonas prunicola]|uniref:Rap1a/Tai family immunity protein n=1 Tax=Xanthomonas prunicola TaxID=2053930 RepID=UPI001A9C6E1D|nr:Rap1a/Tai family immunity protein [Xanthomonas prunicola]
MVQFTSHPSVHMQRHLLWLALATLTAVSTTAMARAPEPWELSGRKLIEAGLDGSLAPEITAPEQAELKVMLSANRAGAYLLGVASTSYRAQWCMPAGKTGIPDLQAIIADIDALPDARQDEAAPGLIVQALAKRYPCGSGGRAGSKRATGDKQANAGEP